jgi:hypothetical protein
LTVDIALAFEAPLSVAPPSARRVVEPENICESIDPVLDISSPASQPDCERTARSTGRATGS